MPARGGKEDIPDARSHVVDYGLAFRRRLEVAAIAELEKKAHFETQPVGPSAINPRPSSGGVTMTTGPTAEVHARKVLSILKGRNVRAGGCQTLKAIRETFIESGSALDDCVDGVEYGVEKGWLNLSGLEVFLTEEGAAQMR